ncbi:MAG: type ISP restriction/modification enzyme [Bauldia sp.]
MANKFDSYLRKLREIPLDEQTEHTGRAALEALLNEFARETGSRGLTIQHEPKRIADKGAPDFKIKKGGLILGYVENKAIGENLDKVLKSDQIKRYKTLSQNIIVTDYLHFAWISKDGIQRESLCHSTDLENPKYRLREDRVAAVSKLLQGFFSTAPEGIGRSQQLALALAVRSKLLRDYLGEELVRQEREHKEGRLFGLFQIFRDQVFHELTLEEFADAFAQMLAYGLFLARLNSGLEQVTLHNAREYVPGSFRLIRELVDFLIELEKYEYRDVRWVVEEVLSIVNSLDLAAIHEDLSFRRRKAISRNVRATDEEEHRLFERDPFIYFYEDYLKAYDPAMRKSRGVYYTPPPIVNFIVRAVDDILKDSFSIHDGLADHKRVTVLDFACGTGTFLLEVFQRIFDNIGGPETGRAEPIVREHILKNLFGFEYLIAPYTIAHLKLSQYLRDQGHPLDGDERLQVFLTNTLEPVEPQMNLLLPAISAEAEAAQRVKEQPVLVITGNPPYSAISRNKGPHASASIGAYKWVDGKPLGEKKHWLNDDYVKFIRFAQQKMDAVEEGVVGIITNHSWLDNPTFRGMRQSLMSTFDQIYVLNLHGNAEKKERPPGGGEDQNVFDIKQGVAIGVFVKKAGLPRGVFHADAWGSRQSKYETAAKETLKTQIWNELQPTSPYYFFIPQTTSGRAEYNEFRSIADIISLSVTGIVTARDGLVVAFSERELRTRINKFIDPTVPDEEIRTSYAVGDNYQWKLATARKALEGEPFNPNLVEDYNFRPFDRRKLYNDGRLVFRPRRAVMRNFKWPNIGLITTRITKDEGAVFCTLDPIAHKSASAYDISYVFPLYVHPADQSQQERGRRAAENLSPDFRSFLDARYDHHYSPEEVFGYVYAVLHAPTYRSRYAEFLRIDFPRVPFPDSAEDFENLSVLGWGLVQAHLLLELPQRGLAAYHGKGNHTVEGVRYSLQEQAIWINTTQRFEPVTPAVWEFQIGGYQVLDNYLKSRKARSLSLDEITHVSAIADSLAFTIEQMAEIDKAYRATFPDRG